MPRETNTTPFPIISPCAAHGWFAPACCEGGRVMHGVLCYTFSRGNITLGSALPVSVPGPDNISLFWVSPPAPADPPWPLEPRAASTSQPGALLNGHIIIVIICFVLWWRHYLGRRGLHKGHDLSKETIFTQNNHVSAWTKPFNINLDFSLI